LATVFFHIPRTGGSTLWHTLKARAIGANINVLDLYEQSVVQYQSPVKACDVLEKWLKEQSPQQLENTVCHHHAYQNITRLLPPGPNSYTTIVRDPVERIISNALHHKEFWRVRNDNPMTIKEWDGFTDDFNDALLEENFPLEELCLMAASQPFFQNSYIKHFWHLLLSDPTELVIGKWPNINDIFSKTVDAVLDSFDFIGVYPDLTRTCFEISRHMKLPFPNIVMLTTVYNGLVKPNLSEDIRERMRELNEADYQFLEELGCQLEVEKVKTSVA
jgi:hypothetical protein